MPKRAGGRFAVTMPFTLVSDMDPDVGAVVSAAAMQTMRGAARVTVSFEMAWPELGTVPELVGIVDFDRDRCRLDAQAEAAELAMVFAGPVAYMRQADGRWTWTKGAPGTHNMFDPRWPLEALVHAGCSAVAVGTDVVELTLEYERLNASTDIGMSPDWDESTALVHLSPDARIARVTLTHRSHDQQDALDALGPSDNWRSASGPDRAAQARSNDLPRAVQRRADGG